MKRLGGIGIAAAMASMTIGLSGIPAVASPPRPRNAPPPTGFPSRRDWSHITHTFTEKPLTKRQKRRLRGKRKAKT